MPALATDKKSVSRFYNFKIRLDVKRVVDSGEVFANEADASGTLVTFNRPFKDIDSITATVRETGSFNVVVDFVDVPNPTSFYVYVYRAATRESRIVYWIARGIA